MPNYIALIRKADDSDYGVEFPDLPGCITAGRDLDETFAFAREALALHLEAPESAGPRSSTRPCACDAAFSFSWSGPFAERASWPSLDSNTELSPRDAFAFALGCRCRLRADTTEIHKFEWRRPRRLFTENPTTKNHIKSTAFKGEQKCRASVLCNDRGRRNDTNIDCVPENGCSSDRQGSR